MNVIIYLQARKSVARCIVYLFMIQMRTTWKFVGYCAEVQASLLRHWRQLTHVLNCNSVGLYNLHSNTHTHTHTYIYIYMYVCMYVCMETINGMYLSRSFHCNPMLYSLSVARILLLNSCRPDWSPEVWKPDLWSDTPEGDTTMIRKMLVVEKGYKNKYTLLAEKQPHCMVRSTW